MALFMCRNECIKTAIETAKNNKCLSIHFKSASEQATEVHDATHEMSGGPQWKDSLVPLFNISLFIIYLRLIRLSNFGIGVTNFDITSSLSNEIK